MKLGIYINNKNIANINCENLLNGNPGIGGTEYCILLLAQVYKLYYPEDMITLFVAKQSLLPTVDNMVTVANIEALPEAAHKENVDVLITSAVYNGMPLPQLFFDLIDEKKVKTILWGHNFYLSDFCDKIVQSQYVKANVFVGHQQYDRYVDHEVIKKSTYIYNIYPTVNKKPRAEVHNHIVTYIGSLVPMKGFHILAEAWKAVLKAVPDAELYVIGSGKLYGRNSKLGKYGIAEETYENVFMPSLIDSYGRMLASVHFCGVLGAEKDEVIRDTAVGVVNPTGRTETFGISALDFESLGVPVVTIAKGGFLDTVQDGKTGILYKKQTELAGDIVELLVNPQENKLYGENGIEFCKEFLPDKIIKQWRRLIEKVQNDESLEYIEPSDFMNTNLKIIRCLNRKIKNVFGIEYSLSVIGVESLARNILRKVGK